MDLIFEDWGLIPYELALTKQLELVETLHKQELPGYLIFCQHPPVVTLGRATQPGDVFAWKGNTVEVSRGGRATYHGPNQLVVYPILNLTRPRKGRSSHEIAGYLRTLESAIAQVISDYGVANVVGRSLQKNPLTQVENNETGVWIGTQKIASLGIGVRKWITFHGAAINLIEDPEAFQGMNPCGLKSNVMTSLEKETGKSIDIDEFKKRLRSHLAEVL